MQKTELLVLAPTSLNRKIHAVAHGAIYLCTGGEASLMINFDRWHLRENTAIVFFPGDVVQWQEVSPCFRSSVVRYSPEILRSASMNIEHAVYSLLREDRLCTRKEVIEKVVKSIFRLLDFYFSDPLISNRSAIVDSLLHSFFMGFSDYISHQGRAASSRESNRTETLFNKFMEILENRYCEAHDVAWYAGQLNISRKYLGIIVKNKTGETPKKIIDEYIILQLQLALRTSQKSLKQIAADFHFADPSVLTRYFKTHTGVNPLRYRNS